MIGYLSGRLLSKEPSQIVLETGGVGYLVEVPLSTYYELGGPGSEAALHIHTYVREDAIALFGFKTTGERSLFRRLIAISGVGPKLALAIIGGMGPAEFLAAIDGSDLIRIVQIPGIGRKTGERLILELKDRIPELQAEMDLEPAAATLSGSKRRDLLSALENLGYKHKDAEKAIQIALAKIGDDADFEETLKQALAVLIR